MKKKACGQEGHPCGKPPCEPDRGDTDSVRQRTSPPGMQSTGRHADLGETRAPATSTPGTADYRESGGGGRRCKMNGRPRTGTLCEHGVSPLFFSSCCVFCGRDFDGGIGKERADATVGF